MKKYVGHAIVWVIIVFLLWILPSLIAALIIYMAWNGPIMDMFHTNALHYTTSLLISLLAFGTLIFVVHPKK